MQKYKAIWTKIEDFKYINLNALPIYDDRYIKTKIRTCGDKVYTNFHGLNVPENDKECESLPSFLLILYLYMKTNLSASIFRQLCL